MTALEPKPTSEHTNLDAPGGNPRPPEGEPLSRTELSSAIKRGVVREVEVLWPDHQGIPRGKRVPAHRFLEQASGHGFPFCDAALGWDHGCVFHDGLRLTGWNTGCADFVARPDLTTVWPLPWRHSSVLAHADLTGHDGALVPTAPRTVLHRAIERLRSMGFDAEVGVEFEFHLLTPEGQPLATGDQAYSLERMNQMEPAFGQIFANLEPFVAIEAGNVEYGPGQCEINLVHDRPLAAADQAVRLRYAVRELARRNGARATFMAKPFNGVAGNSMHLHVSLWRDGQPMFSPADGSESPLHQKAVGGVLRHLPGIVLYGAPSVNSYKRFEPLSFAPTTASWGRDNRTCAIRSLIAESSATRFELRTGAADANVHLLVAAVLAAISLGIENEIEPPPLGAGNMYDVGEPLPETLGDAVKAARSDVEIVEVLGEDAVHDFTTLSEAEWRAFCRHVSDWDRDRYLSII